MNHPLRIFAELAAVTPTSNPGDLVLVNLPANCSVEGTMSEFRLMLEDAVQIARRHRTSPGDIARLTEIEAWLRGEMPDEP